MPRHAFQLIRVYDGRARRAGVVVLADRLWPRGVTKEQAGIDRWAKGIAPSAELRKWYHRNPDSFEEFAERYRAELASEESAAGLDEIRELLECGPLTLVTAAKHIGTSHLAVLRDVLEDDR